MSLKIWVGGEIGDKKPGPKKEIWATEREQLKMKTQAKTQEKFNISVMKHRVTFQLFLSSWTFKRMLEDLGSLAALIGERPPKKASK